MEKLKIYYSSYLPYNITALFVGRDIITIKGLEVHHKKGFCVNWDSCVDEIRKFKLILKPFLEIVDDWDSLMDKYSEHHNRSTVWDEWYEHIVSFSDKIDEANILSCPYDLMQILLEEHYDVFTLIEKDLALDMNTII